MSPTAAIRAISASTVESTETTRVTRGRPSVSVSLIDGERLEFPDCFKKCTAFNEHAATGHRRQPRDNRYQSRDYQRARASDDQQY